MASIVELETSRLRMRQWRESDRAPFAAMNADPAVMEFFASPPSPAASDASIDAWQAQFAAQGWSNWAVELRESSEFIGFTGLSVPRRTFSLSPCVEVGWRLARQFWGRGFATEAARAALRVAFERLSLEVARRHGTHWHAQHEPGFRIPRHHRRASLAPSLPVSHHQGGMGRA
jgi:RimJ/RimL family protein N-acetyltransferase